MLPSQAKGVANAAPVNKKGKHMQDIELELYEPSIQDFNMFSVYIGDLVKEISTGKIWIVDDIGKNFIIGKIGETTSYMSRSKFIWVASPSTSGSWK